MSAPRAAVASPVRRIVVAVLAAATVVAAALTGATDSQAGARLDGVPRADCGKGSRPETSIQGRVPTADYKSGRALKGYRCNAVQVGHYQSLGGLKVQRYTDQAGRTCAYYDTSLLLLNIGHLLEGPNLGVVVLDMTDPKRPRKTANLISPAMLNPHESLLVNHRRGLLVGVLGTLATAPGIMDVYDISKDCRRPRLLSTTPSALLGHESGFAPDGKTFWSAGAAGFTLTAVDLTNPRLPKVLDVHTGVIYHGLRLSPDGRTMYVANMGIPTADSILDDPGLHVLDVSEVQDRVPDPKVRKIGEVSWPEVSIPQVAEPFTRGGRTYVFEVDEFTDWFGHKWSVDFINGPVGAARIIDVTNPRRPKVVSNVRLEVHDPRLRDDAVMDDPGATGVVKGYAAHYCSVPYRKAPRLAACAMIGSGLRVFDIRDVKNPREVAYFNKPGKDGAMAVAQPAWDVKRRQVWFTDGDDGFYAVRLTNGVGKLLRR